MQAVCPASHTADVAIDKNLKKKFKVGQSIKVRVWELDGNAVLVTHKRTLLEFPLDMLISIPEHAVKGLVTLGIVSKVSELGLTVHFLNKIKVISF